MASTLKTNAIEPEGATTTLNVGRTGKNVIITDNLKANVLKDAGTNAVFTSNGSGVLSGVNAGFGSAQVLIETATPSGVSEVSFTSGITSTYKEYVFQYINMHGGTNDTEWQFQVSSDGGSNYNLQTTSTFFRAYHVPNSSASMGYTTGRDTNGTTFIVLSFDCGIENDECTCGILHLFNPSSNALVKNWWSRSTTQQNSDAALDGFSAGYFNTTAVINAVRFKFSAGNTDSGIIKMYGIK